jgi:hypothetical protein
MHGVYKRKHGYWGDRIQHTVLFPKEGQVTRNISFLRYPSRSKNNFLLSADQNIANFIVLEACSENVIWPSFGNTSEYYGRVLRMQRCTGEGA